MPTDTNELEGLVTKAQQATKHLEAALRPVAFGRVLDHLLANCEKTGAVVSGLQDSPGRPGTKAEKADGILAGEQQRIDALARYFKISPENVQHIFDTTEEEPKLALAMRHLSQTKSHATKEIALLVAGALTAIGMQTTTSLVRRVADTYGKLDGPNFMSTLANLEEISVLGKPRSPNRVIRMKVPGVEEAQALAQRIVG